MKKSHNETEMLSGDEQKLREMCRSLKKVDAPSDFEFKVKARLASAEPSQFEPRFGFAVRYALPALAVILVLGLIAYTGGLLSSNNTPLVVQSSDAPSDPAVPQIAAVPNSAPPEIVKQPDNNVAVTMTETPKTIEKSQPQIVARTVQFSKKDLPRAKKDTFVGWKQSALSVDTPKQLNINSNSVMPKISDIESTNSPSLKEVLTANGINAAFENGKWTVKSVRANSLGESSGIREKDVIEELDNQPLGGGETTVNRTMKIRTVTVLRNGEKMKIELQGKQ